ncbi:MAG TPA: hypothetical protein VHU91_09105, partial [Mycobacteriales bacterium]|nr:hypothetical protein [Mycobacteriales bacterium]
GDHAGDQRFHLRRRSIPRPTGNTQMTPDKIAKAGTLGQRHHRNQPSAHDIRFRSSKHTDRTDAP